MMKPMNIIISLIFILLAGCGMTKTKDNIEAKAQPASDTKAEAKAQPASTENIKLDDNYYSQFKNLNTVQPRPNEQDVVIYDNGPQTPQNPSSSVTDTLRYILNESSKQ